MQTPLPSWLDFFSKPASWMYERIVRIRNASFDRGRNVKRVSIPVISVGNLSVGGTGKTPIVTWIVRCLRTHGYNPAIVMRGYGAVDPSLADEALEYKERLEDIDLIIGGERYVQIEKYLNEGGKADCLVMDDGFQHRRLHRDLDIAVLDYLRDVLSQRMLPAGWLREPIDGLKRADALVITHAQRCEPTYAAKLEALTGKEPVAWAAHHWTVLSVHESTGDHDEELDWLTGKSVAVRLGIGHPRPVVEALVRLGAKIAQQLPAGDHQPFTQKELDLLARTSREVDAIVMTMKDWVKARDVIDLSTLHCPIVVPHLKLEIMEGESDFESLLLSVFKLR